MKTILRSVLPIPYLILIAAVHSQSYQENFTNCYEIHENEPYEWRSVENVKHLEFLDGSSYRNKFDKDDDKLGVAEIGFDFDFYGRTFNRVVITSNGTIHPVENGDAIALWLGYLDSHYKNDDFSVRSSRQNISVFWDDLYLGDGHIVYETKGNPGSREFVVTWHGVHRMETHDENGGGFQVVLKEGTHDIIFNYHDVEFGDEKFDNGKSATIGLSNYSGSSSTIYGLNEAVVSKGKTIRFSYIPADFAPIITSPKMNQTLENGPCEVRWEYSGVYPAEVSLSIRQSDELPFKEIKIMDRYDSSYFFSGIPKSLILNELPTNGKMTTIGLTVGDKDWNSYYSSIVFYPQSDPSLFSIFGDTDFWEQTSSVFQRYRAYLFKKEDDRKYLIRDENLDFWGKYNFSNLSPGSYEIGIYKHRIDRNPTLIRNIQITDSDIHLDDSFHSDVESREPISGSTIQMEDLLFKWKFDSSAPNAKIVLYDALGGEVGSQITTDEQLRWNGELEANKTYYWSIALESDNGSVHRESKELSFQLSDGSIPVILSPLTGRQLPSYKLEISWEDMPNVAEKWKLELKPSENAEPYWTGEFDSNVHEANLDSLQDTGEFVYVTLSYLQDKVWREINTFYRLPCIDVRIEQLPNEDSDNIPDGQYNNYIVKGESVPALNYTDIQMFSNSKHIPEITEKLVNKSWSENEGIYQLMNLHGCELNEYNFQFTFQSNGGRLSKTVNLPSSYDGNPPQVGRKGYSIDDKIDFEWIDATQGDRLPLKKNDDEYRLQIPFAFRYYGQEYRTLRITSKGVAVFEPRFAFGEHYILGSRDLPNTFVSPLGNVGFDLVYGGGVYCHTVGEAPSRKFVVQWDKVSLRESWNEENVTFQVVFHESSNEIVYQYLDTFFADTPSWINKNYGAASSVGMENQDGTHATIYSIRSPVLKDHSSIKFTPLD